MDQKRYDALTDNENLPLTPEEFLEGWHFCPDWDLLLVGPGMEEMKACTCRRVDEEAIEETARLEEARTENAKWSKKKR